MSQENIDKIVSALLTVAAALVGTKQTDEIFKRYLSHWTPGD